MTENEKINGWTFEETVKNAENLMEAESNMFKWDVLRHLRDFAENFKDELEQYSEIGTIEELKSLQEDYWKLNEMLKFYSEIGTVEEFKDLKEKSVVKKPIVKGVMGFDGEEAYYCPSCKEKLYEGHFEIGLCNCGQSISYWAKE